MGSGPCARRSVCGCGGGWNERTARTELGDVQARVRAGVWKRPKPPALPEPPTEVPSFHEYASAWLAAKQDGTIGDKPLAPSTYHGYRANLSLHLLPFFAGHRLDEIDRQLCLAFKAHKIREAAELRETIAAGADIRDRRNQHRRPLGASSIRDLIKLLAMILDEAIEDEIIDRNPARGKRMRIQVPKPARSFLELDELAALLDAASTQGALPTFRPPCLPRTGPRQRSRAAPRPATGPATSPQSSRSPRRRSPSTSDAWTPRRRSGTSAAAPSSRSSPAAAPAPASCATSASATSACTTPTARASTYATPRPTPASARSR